jgi:hypothetical protein
LRAQRERSIIYLIIFSIQDHCQWPWWRLNFLLISNFLWVSLRKMKFLRYWTFWIIHDMELSWLWKNYLRSMIKMIKLNFLWPCQNCFGYWIFGSLRKSHVYDIEFRIWYWIF